MILDFSGMYESTELNQTLELRDGRKLGFAEFGDLNGKPIFHFHGHPGSRYEVLLHGDKPTKLGLHVIAAERPGIGLSDFQPRRKLLDWPDDIIELADHLGIEKFTVEGISGGGPYAAACAYKIPHRLECCAIVGGMGPINMRKKGMMRSNRIDFFIARRLPFIVKYMVKKTMKKLNDPDKAKDFMKRIFKTMAEPDRILVQDSKLLDIFTTEFREAFRSGPDGVTYEEKIYVKPWGFELSDISPDLQVYLWHGGLDVIVPISIGREMCDLIPNCKGYFYPEEAHLSFVYKHFEEIAKVILGQ